MKKRKKCDKCGNNMKKQDFGLLKQIIESVWRCSGCGKSKKYHKPKDGIPGFSDTLEQMDRIQVKKNTDYSGTINPFRNFEIVEKIGVASAEQGILVRMTDKISRISNLLDKEPEVFDERIEDTLIDLANYSIILKCYLEYKRKLMEEKENAV